MHDNYVRSANPTAIVGSSENSVLVGRCVVAERKQIVQFNQFRNVKPELPCIRRAVCELHPPLSDFVRPGNRILSVHNTLKL